MKILMSIKPQFVEKIRRGEKKYEFRRVLPRCQEIDTIIVYASKPGKTPPQSYCYLNGYEEWRASNTSQLFLFNFANKNK